MSDELRQSLRTMKAVIEAEGSAPVTYLHDPEGCRAFAALVRMDAAGRMAIEGWDPMDHDHREGDEDEPYDEAPERRAPHHGEGLATRALGLASSPSPTIGAEDL
jgi:hypothetical protein